MKNIIEELIELTEKSVKDIRERLDAPILDGTPFLLCITDDLGVVRVYGDWDGIKGFRGADVVPNHLCGCITFSRERASQNCAAIASKSPEQKPYVTHWRAFLSERLGRETERLAHWRSMLPPSLSKIPLLACGEIEVAS